MQQQEKDKEDRERTERQSAQDAESYRQFMDNQRKLQEKLSGEVERDRALFMKTPPVPPQKNLLLGQWRLVTGPKKKTGQCHRGDQRGDFAGGVCEMVFGDGIWDFRPKAMYGIDARHRRDEVERRRLPRQRGPNRRDPQDRETLRIQDPWAPIACRKLTSTRIGVEPCSFVRVGAGAQAASPAAAREPRLPGAPSAAAAQACSDRESAHRGRRWRRSRWGRLSLR